MRVCVVGAGVSGLPSIKACVEEGFDVVCYEKTEDIGGLWNYRPEMREGGTVMRTTVVNTSKEMMAYSDFVPHPSLPNFMHHTKLLQYIRDYADHFDLRKYVNLKTPVKHISPCDSGGWLVELENGKKERFDRVILCTGHHAEPLHPQFRDSHKFTGRMMHAHEYRDTTGLEGKDVFLVGIGNSALDIAVDLAKIAKSVTISTRRGSWIFNRIVQGGMPYDVVFMTRIYEMMKAVVPWSVLNDFMEHRQNLRLDHDLFGLRPNHRFFQQHPTVNDSLANLIQSGHITITEDVDTFDGSDVIVKGGKAFHADILITCTGYTFSFPILDKGIIKIQDHQVHLYKYVFPVDRDDIAVIGLIQPIGSIAPISEIQSRWATAVWAGRVGLPNRKEREEDITQKRAAMERRYYKSIKHTLQVDYMSYMDEIAELIGCHPRPFEYLFSNPRFGWRLICGPNAPYVYRLRGRGRWMGAERAVEELPDRVKQPMKNRECRVRRHKRRGRVNEWFRYVSLKWLAGWTLLLLVSGTFVFCMTPLAISPFAFFLLVTVFLLLFSFLLLWFDLQYDMSTIL